MRVALDVPAPLPPAISVCTTQSRTTLLSPVKFQHREKLGPSHHSSFSSQSEFLNHKVWGALLTAKAMQRDG